jgi:acid phosphatase
MRPQLARLAVSLALSCALLVAAVRTEARPVPRLDHVIVVIMENKEYSMALSGPYTLSLAADASSFSGSYAIRHPSQPNYLALWAGSTLSVTNDNCPPFGSPYSAENLGHACEAAGLTWRAYSENLPAAGYAGCTANGSLYTRSTTRGQASTT